MGNKQDVITDNEEERKIKSENDKIITDSSSENSKESMSMENELERLQHKLNSKTKLKTSSSAHLKGSKKKELGKNNSEPIISSKDEKTSTTKKIFQRLSKNFGSKESNKKDN